MGLMSQLTAIVLAAGQGKRMKSALPKVLHPIAGRPLLHFSVAAALQAGAERARLVVSPAGQQAVRTKLEEAFDPARLEFATQEQPLGTGHAVRVGVEGLDSDRVLILYGDTPLLEARDLAALVDTLDEDDNPELALLTCELRDATGYGRILRDAQGRVVEVREHRDLENEQQRAIREVNSGGH
jgi:bifunctional UDP-N-acetylglucosamine pyrophosphorylase/glucosamine-1-phosphate N-acetyltransferase